MAERHEYGKISRYGDEYYHWFCFVSVGKITVLSRNGKEIAEVCARPISVWFANKASFACKQGFFAMQTRLVWRANKASF